MLIFFSIPVVVTGLAELALYDMATLVIGVYYPSSYAGYFNVSSTIARFPLIISMAVATSVLPATAEAMSLKDHDLLKTYILQSYRYVSFVVIPLCVGTVVFASPIISLLFGQEYLPGIIALQILAAGMLFFTLYTISSSIAQGLGNPRLPMYVLIGGTTLDLVLSLLLVPPMGINGAAIATTLASLFIMSILMWKTLKISKCQFTFTRIWKNYNCSRNNGINIHSISTDQDIPYNRIDTFPIHIFRNSSIDWRIKIRRSEITL